MSEPGDRPHAGPMLDAEIACVLGKLTGTRRNWRRSAPPFSTDIQAAWTVVELLRRLGLGVLVTSDPEAMDLERPQGCRPGDVWLCMVSIPTSPVFIIHFSTWDATAPMAICRVALEVINWLYGSPAPQSGPGIDGREAMSPASSRMLDRPPPANGRRLSALRPVGSSPMHHRGRPPSPGRAQVGARAEG